MRRLSKILGNSKSRKHFSQSKPRLFESLEKREMMAVTPLYYSTALSPAKIDPISVLTPAPNTGVLDKGHGSTVPAFSSLPGAPATIYLDFDGHFQDVAAVQGGANLFSPAFSLDSNNSNWNGEVNAIREIWARVAEDYAPFNINVTTVNPGDFSHGSHNLRVVITGEDFRADKDQGGVAHKNSFSLESAPNVVYVFSISKGFAEDDPAGVRPLSTIANLISHEAGHAFGLEHQSVLKNGKVVEEYNPGDDKKAPLMGNANGSERGIWWKGTDKNGKTQDDMAIIASATNGFGFRIDENNISFAEPEQLQYVNGVLEGRGIVNSTSDVDVFRFDTHGGRIAVSLMVARVDNSAGATNIGNLDAVVELYNNKGQLLARGDSDSSLDAAVDVSNLPAANYFVKVLSKGAYGDLGQYRLIVEEMDPPRVVSSQLANLGANLAGVWIQFNKPIKADTFTTADIQAGGVSVLSVTADVNDPTRFLVTVTAPSISLWSLAIGPDIRDLHFGNQMMDQNRDGLQGTTSGVIVRVNADDFLALLDWNAEPLVVHAPGGIFRTKHQYLTSYRGLAFHANTVDKLPLPAHAQLVEASKIWIPG